MAAAAAAIDQADFAAALPLLYSAQALLAAIPDGSAAGATVTYDRASIAQLIQVCQRRSTSTIRTSKLEPRRPTSDS